MKSAGSLIRALKVRFSSTVSMGYMMSSCSREGRGKRSVGCAMSAAMLVDSYRAACRRANTELHDLGSDGLMVGWGAASE